MSVHGLGRNNYNYSNFTNPKAKGNADGGEQKKAGENKQAQKADGYKPTHGYSDEVKKDMALAKANDIDYKLAMKGRRYEDMEKQTDRYPAFDSSKLEDYDKAVSEWNKFSELKEATAKDAPAADTSNATPAASTDPKTGIYKPDLDKVREMKADLKGNISAFKQMVSALFKNQSGAFSDTMKALLEIDEDTQARAKAAISEDGEWGVEATANRILEFAKAISGGDPDKIEGLRDAVNQGFKAAEKLWGGQLPDISYQTLQKVMDGFDEWAKQAQNDQQVELV